MPSTNIRTLAASAENELLNQPEHDDLTVFISSRFISASSARHFPFVSHPLVIKK